MCLTAAFLWTKSPQCSISTLIIGEEFRFLSTPKIYYLPQNFFSFRKVAKKVIIEFFSELESLQKLYKQTIKLEYKITFNILHIPYLLPAKESQFVYKIFIKWANRTKKNIQQLQIERQLRKKLSGRSLKKFKRELRSLHLVSRKRKTGFEYHLWTVALHATNATYAKKLEQVRRKILDEMWRNY